MSPVNDARLRLIAAAGLVVGAACGIGGTFVSSASLRGLAWGIDGSALVVASALLAVYYFRHDNDLAAAGFLVFVAGQTLIVSCSAMALEASTPTFGAGVALWAMALVLVSASKAMPPFVNGVGLLSGLLFLIVAVQILTGHPLTPLSEPLPTLAFPFFAITILGWAWAHVRAGISRSVAAYDGSVERHSR